MADNSLPISDKNLPIGSGENVPLEQLGHSIGPRQYVKTTRLEDLAIEKASKGITWEDIRDKFACSKGDAQRKLKYFHSMRVLFTAQDLMDQGLDLPPSFGNTKPQRYYATSIKADIIEKIKKEYKNVPIKPTGIRHSSVAPLSNAMEHQKAQSFLDVLVAWGGTAPFYIHKIQLQLNVERACYDDINIIESADKNEAIQPKKRAKLLQEYVGMTRVNYIYSPNGKVQISVACSRYPFKIETDEDIGILFSFFGQVRDRMLYHLHDPHERKVPVPTKWRLVGCDVNKDIMIDEKMQLTLPDIQLKDAVGVFRLYVKPSGDNAFYRIEESVSPNIVLPQRLDSIRNLNKAIEAKIDGMTKLLKQFIAKEGA